MSGESRDGQGLLPVMPMAQSRLPGREGAIPMRAPHLLRSTGAVCLRRRPQIQPRQMRAKLLAPPRRNPRPAPMKRGIKSRFKPLATALHGAFSCPQTIRLSRIDLNLSQLACENTPNQSQHGARQKWYNSRDETPCQDRACARPRYRGRNGGWLAPRGTLKVKSNDCERNPSHKEVGG